MYNGFCGIQNKNRRKKEEEQQATISTEEKKVTEITLGVASLDHPDMYVLRSVTYC